MSNRNCHRTSVCSKLIAITIGASLMSVVAGCGTFGNSKVVQQLQNENDRLLAEFRAQRDQNLQLTQRLSDAQTRLAESEKMLARLSPLSPSQRLSRLGSEANTPRGSASPARPLPSGILAGKADAAASLSPDRNNATSDATSAGVPLDFQWRPMRKERN